MSGIFGGYAANQPSYQSTVQSAYRTYAPDSEESARNDYARNKNRERQRVNWWGSEGVAGQHHAAQAPRAVPNASYSRAPQQLDNDYEAYEPAVPRQSQGNNSYASRTPFGTDADMPRFGQSAPQQSVPQQARYAYAPPARAPAPFGTDVQFDSSRFQRAPQQPASASFDFEAQAALPDSRYERAAPDNDLGYELRQKQQNRLNPVFRNAPFATDSNDNLTKYQPQSGARREPRRERRHHQAEPTPDSPWQTEQASFSSHQQHVQDSCAGQSDAAWTQYRRKRVLNASSASGKRYNLLTGAEL